MIWLEVILLFNICTHALSPCLEMWRYVSDWLQENQIEAGCHPCVQRLCWRERQHYSTWQSLSFCTNICSIFRHVRTHTKHTYFVYSVITFGKGLGPFQMYYQSNNKWKQPQSVWTTGRNSTCIAQSKYLRCSAVWVFCLYTVSVSTPCYITTIASDIWIQIKKFKTK